MVDVETSGDVTVVGRPRRRDEGGSSLPGRLARYFHLTFRQCYEDSILLTASALAWDGIDEMRANAAGWRTGVILDLPFRHYRPEGVRDGSARRARMAQGSAAHYFGYRPTYLVLRSLHHARREPAALAMIWGYAAARTRMMAP